MNHITKQTSGGTRSGGLMQLCAYGANIECDLWRHDIRCSEPYNLSDSMLYYFLDREEGRPTANDLSDQFSKYLE